MSQSNPVKPQGFLRKCVQASRRGDLVSALEPKVQENIGGRKQGSPLFVLL